MNRLEAVQFLRSFFPGLMNAETEPPAPKTALKPFLDLVLSLKRDLPLSIPLLRELSLMIKDREGAPSMIAGSEAGIIKRRIERRYQRLCRVQEELGNLDLKKAAPGGSGGFTLEDYVFSQIDFSRYRKIDEKKFESFFPEALTDFSEAFLKKNFSLGRNEIQSLIEGSYEKTDGLYNIHKENPLILSIMRTLETSLENSSLFSAEEIRTELKKLLDFTGGPGKGEPLPGSERLFPFLVLSLDGVHITHEDGMAVNLVISPQGDLSGIFRPAGKPWTRVLIPSGEIMGR